jgi:hypothetical protein
MTVFISLLNINNNVEPAVEDSNRITWHTSEPIAQFQLPVSADIRRCKYRQQVGWKILQVGKVVPHRTLLEHTPEELLDNNRPYADWKDVAVDSLPTDIYTLIMTS